ncbi:MAG TPA: OmpA family protein [Gammaproteobacteria bacterium]|nr:OmpA family protein [Gammaproteobacteria bacterium]
MRASLKITSIAVLAFSLGLSGCQTTNPYTGEQQASKTSIGAGIGAVAGAAVGALSGSNAKERRKRALIGAGIGGLSGAGIGQYMDRQEAKLREQLRGTGVSVTRNGNDITLNMPGNITFATNSSDVQPNFVNVINSVALVLKEYPKTVIEVAGHTDSTGSANYNQLLSERRADSVATILRRQGVNEQRLVISGYGPNHPIASNSTAQGREQNRRVELTLSPLTAN